MFQDSWLVFHSHRLSYASDVFFLNQPISNQVDRHFTSKRLCEPQLRRRFEVQSSSARCGGVDRHDAKSMNISDIVDSQSLNRDSLANGKSLELLWNPCPSLFLEIIRKENNTFTKRKNLKTRSSAAPSTFQSINPYGGTISRSWSDRFLDLPIKEGLIRP